MKRTIALILLTLLTTATMFAQQPRRVYITLDVSGSMYGAKYELANYTVQMLATLCEPEDEVYLIIDGMPQRLSGPSDLKKIRIPMDNYKGVTVDADISQFGDIQAFNRVYKPKAGTQDWLFIVGDGAWGTYRDAYKSDCKTFQRTTAGGTLNVCYLQTDDRMSGHNDFTAFAEDLGIVDIRKSDTDPSTIRKECNYFARKILSFSDTDFKTKAKGSTLKLTFDLPVKEFIVVYQSPHEASKLPNLNAVNSSEGRLTMTEKGTPTTEGTESEHGGFNLFGGGSNTLSGRVWKVKANGTIPSGTAIELAFDKNVKGKDVCIYPIVEEEIYGAFDLQPVNGVRMLDEQTTAICRNDKEAEIAITLNEKGASMLPEKLLKNAKVEVKAAGKSHKAKYKNGQFACTIPVDSEEVQYYAEIDCPGYMHLTTPIRKLKKVDDCPPPTPAPTPKPTPIDKKLPTLEGGTLQLELLDPIRLTIHDQETMETLDPSKFDFAIDLNDAYLFEEPNVRIDGNNIVIENLKLKGGWCECLFPSDLNITITSTPKQGVSFEGDKLYQRTEIPIHYKIAKSSPWLQRCLGVLFTIIGLLAGLIYIIFLYKKNRFKRNARITPYYWTLDDDDKIKGGNLGHPLRKKGFAAWFCRWFLPGDERNAIATLRPQSKITYIASDSKNKILFSVKDFNRDTMTTANYDPDHAKKGQRYVELRNNDELTISKRNGQRDGKLVFTSGSKDDEGAYLTFLVILEIAITSAIATLAFLLMRSLFL